MQRLGTIRLQVVQEKVDELAAKEKEVDSKFREGHCTSSQSELSRIQSRLPSEIEEYDFLITRKGCPVICLNDALNVCSPSKCLDLT